MSDAVLPPGRDLAGILIGYLAAAVRAGAAIAEVFEAFVTRPISDAAIPISD